MSEGCGRCWKCREGTGCIRSVAFSQMAMPGRFPETVRIVNTDDRWATDMGAYRRIRSDGVQPPRIDGCGELEARADSQYEVELGLLVPKEERPRVEEGLAITQEMDLQVARPKSVKVPND